MATTTYSDQFTGQDLEDVRQVAEWAVLHEAETLCAVADGDGIKPDTPGTVLTRIEVLETVRERLVMPGFPSLPILDLSPEQLRALAAAVSGLAVFWGGVASDCADPEDVPFFERRVGTCRRALAAIEAVS